MAGVAATRFQTTCTMVRTVWGSGVFGTNPRLSKVSLLFLLTLIKLIIVYILYNKTEKSNEIDNMWKLRMNNICVQSNKNKKQSIDRTGAYQFKNQRMRGSWVSISLKKKSAQLFSKTISHFTSNLEPKCLLFQTF